MDGFPFSTHIEVRYRDVDAMNHVNNAVYVTYLEVARTRLSKEHMEFAGSAREIPFIVARVAVDYRSPIGFGEDVEIGLAVKAIGSSSYTLTYRVEADGRLAAEAESVQVHFDYATNRPMPLEGERRASLERLRMETGDRAQGTEED
jgi:acyl-CoA thioester hydrolase